MSLVDEQDGTTKRGIDVSLPALPKRLGSRPSVMRSEGNLKGISKLTVKVGEVGLGAGERTDDELGMRRQPLGNEPQGDTLATSGLAGNERETTLLGERVLEFPLEAFHGRCSSQRLGGNAR